MQLNISGHHLDITDSIHNYLPSTLTPITPPHSKNTIHSDLTQ